MTLEFFEKSDQKLNQLTMTLKLEKKDRDSSLTNQLVKGNLNKISPTILMID